MNQPIQFEFGSMDQLKTIELYERFVVYIYPKIKQMPREDNALKEKLLSAVLRQVDLINDAGKSDQVSKLYLADSNLASLRCHLRLATSMKLLSKNQAKEGYRLLAEVGNILGAWIKGKKDKGEAGRGIGPVTRRPGI